MDWYVSGSGDPGTKLPGRYFLENFFDLHNIKAWGMFGVLIGYVFFFRFCQYFLMAVQTGLIQLPALPCFGGSVPQAAEKQSPVASGEVNYQEVAPSEEQGVEMGATGSKA